MKITVQAHTNAKAPRVVLLAEGVFAVYVREKGKQKTFSLMTQSSLW